MKELRWAMATFRVAMGVTFLSPVADRFGLWGPAGTPGVAWGGFDPFLDYTGLLLWFLPASLVPIAGWAATVLEIVLAVGLLVGIGLRVFAFASGLLLTVFAVTMTAAFGPEPPLSYSVWTAAAGAFLLASLRPASAESVAAAEAVAAGREHPQQSHSPDRAEPGTASDPGSV